MITLAEMADLKREFLEWDLWLDEEYLGVADQLTHVTISAATGREVVIIRIERLSVEFLRGWLSGWRSQIAITREVSHV